MDSTYRIKENMLEMVAIKSLKTHNKKVTYDKVIAESGRIERIAESFFINTKETDYNKFILNWLYTNVNKILYTDEFSYDTIIPDEAYENNLEKYF